MEPQDQTEGHSASPPCHRSTCADYSQVDPLLVGIVNDLETDDAHKETQHGFDEEDLMVRDARSARGGDASESGIDSPESSRSSMPSARERRYSSDSYPVSAVRQTPHPVLPGPDIQSAPSLQNQGPDTPGLATYPAPWSFPGVYPLPPSPHLAPSAPSRGLRAVDQTSSRTIYSARSPTFSSSEQLSRIASRSYLPQLSSSSADLSTSQKLDPSLAPPLLPPTHNHYHSLSVARGFDPRGYQDGNVPLQARPAQQPQQPVPPPPAQPRQRAPKPDNSYTIPAITGVKPFVTKVRYMLMHPREFGHVVCWSADGESVLVDFGHSHLTNDLLPRVFNHSNSGGFSRQFTNYGFVTLTGQSLVDALAIPPIRPLAAAAVPGSSSEYYGSTGDHGAGRRDDDATAAVAASPDLEVRATDNYDDDDEQFEHVVGRLGEGGGGREPSDHGGIESEHNDDYDDDVEGQGEEEEEEEVRDPSLMTTRTKTMVVVRSAKSWKAFRHAHSTTDLANALAEERQTSVATLGTDRGDNDKEEEERGGDDDDDDDEGQVENGEGEEDGNWFTRDGINDLRLLKRLKPKPGGNRASHHRRGGGGGGGRGKRKKGTPRTEGRDEGGGDDDDVEDDDDEGRLAATKKANKAARTTVAAGGGSLREGGGGGNRGAAGTRFIGGVEMTGNRPT